jgi:hypothetical protein
MLNRLALGAGLIALAGCAEGLPGSSGSRVYYADMQGAAAVCTVPEKVSLGAGAQTEATMVVKNDGGWCGITLSRFPQRPYDAGLLVGRPANGRVHVHSVGDVTRIDYTPDPGFSGDDRFTVRLLPGNPSLRVSVTVQPGVHAAPAAAPAPAKAPAPARKAPAKKK